MKKEDIVKQIKNIIDSVKIMHDKTIELQKKVDKLEKSKRVYYKAKDIK